MHVKRCNGNYKTSRKNEYGYDTLCIVGIQKKWDLGAGYGTALGAYWPQKGSSGLGKHLSLLSFS